MKRRSNFVNIKLTVASVAMLLVVQHASSQKAHPYLFYTPVDGEKLTFKTVKEGVVLKPLYDTHRERYAVYWDLKYYRTLKDK